MKSRIYITLYVFVLLFFSSIVCAQELNLPFFSEEQGVSQCPNGYYIVGIFCRGTYCDTKSLICMPYTNKFDPSARYYWSPWFSEERNGGVINKREFASGLGCSGSYCDNLRIKFTKSNIKTNNGNCYSTKYFSEEGKAFEKCKHGYYVSGISCKGNYCDSLSLTCCEAK